MFGIALPYTHYTIHKKESTGKSFTQHCKLYTFIQSPTEASLTNCIPPDWECNTQSIKREYHI